MVIGFGELKRGLTIEMEGAPYKVEEYYQQKMQQRAPVYHLKLRNLITGQQVEKAMSGTVKLNLAQVENREVTFLYEADGTYTFMDSATFEQYEVLANVVGEASNYLTDQATAELVFFKGRPVSVELETTVDLVVAETAPSFKGDTASGGGKPATLETGLVVNVPMFVTTGDKVRVDTRTGTYLTRVTS
ncbi:MAG: elongation factor P [SAR202 cluster bacterium]|nr:elongation factor P [SAR202 cluster bacterium]